MADDDLIRRGDALDAVHEADSLEMAQFGGNVIADRIVDIPAVTPAVKVKPLVWEAIEQDRGDGSSDLTGDFIAETGFGCYSIVCGFGSDSYVWDVYFGEMDCVSSHDDPSTAKAAAQADYDARIIAALKGPNDE